MKELVLRNSTLPCSKSQKVEYFDEGYEKGVFGSSVVLGNVFTIAATLIWLYYVLHRTVKFVIYHFICPFMNVEPKDRNCCLPGCGRRNNVLRTVDQTLFDRPTRCICCFHSSGLIYSIVLSVTLFMDSRMNSDYCEAQAILTQASIWFSLIMFFEFFGYNFFSVLCGNVRKDVNPKFRLQQDQRKRISCQHCGNEYPRMLQIQHPHVPDGFVISEEQSDPGEEEPYEYTMPRFNKDRKNGGKSLSKLSKLNKLCPRWMIIGTIEIIGYSFAASFAVCMTLIPFFLDVYNPPKDTIGPRKCWIEGFANQMYFLYNILFVGIALMCMSSFTLWMKFIIFQRSVSKDPLVRISCTKTFLYLIVSLSWIVSWGHRYALYATGGEFKDYFWITMLQTFQEFQMTSFTGWLVLVFFTSNFIALFCPMIMDLAICDCFPYLKRWGKNVQEWKRDHVWKNPDLEFGTLFCPKIGSLVKIFKGEFVHE